MWETCHLLFLLWRSRRNLRNLVRSSQMGWPFELVRLVLLASRIICLGIYVIMSHVNETWYIYLLCINAGCWCVLCICRIWRYYWRSECNQGMNKFQGSFMFWIFFKSIWRIPLRVCLGTWYWNSIWIRIL